MFLFTPLCTSVESDNCLVSKAEMGYLTFTYVHTYMHIMPYICMDKEIELASLKKS